MRCSKKRVLVVFPKQVSIDAAPGRETMLAASVRVAGLRALGA
jgi:hypothetical protein